MVCNFRQLSFWALLLRRYRKSAQLFRDSQINFWTKVLRTDQYEKYYFHENGSRPYTTRAIQTWLEGKFHDNYIYKDM